MLNTVNITGRLGGDPELRATPKGLPATSISIANTNGYGDKKRTNWVKVDLFGKTAENLCKYMKKGSIITVEGSLKIDQYEDKQGQKRTFACVVANQVHFESVSRETKPPQSAAELAPTIQGAIDQHAPDDMVNIPF